MNTTLELSLIDAGNDLQQCWMLMRQVKSLSGSKGSRFNHKFNHLPSKLIKKIFIFLKEEDLLWIVSLSSCHLNDENFLFTFIDERERERERDRKRFPPHKTKRIETLLSSQLMHISQSFLPCQSFISGMNNNTTHYPKMLQKKVGRRCLRGIMLWSWRSSRFAS